MFRQYLIIKHLEEVANALAGQRTGFSKYNLRVIDEKDVSSIVEKYGGYKGLLHVDMSNTKWQQEKTIEA